MTEHFQPTTPLHYDQIHEATIASGFTMASDVLTCSLLKTLAASKPSSAFLELGTGTGLSACWILDGMDRQSRLLSIDNNHQYQEIANRYLAEDKRLQLVCRDGGEWLGANGNLKFDYIFADTWHGKYLMLSEALAMLNSGGLYIIDDMIPQPNWPEGHHQKAEQLLADLAGRNDIIITPMQWSTGIVVGVKR